MNTITQFVGTIKIKSINVKYSTYIDFGKENNEKDPKFEVDEYVSILTHRNIIGKGYTLNLSVEVSVIKKLEKNLLWTYVISDLNGEEIVGMFCERELLKTN